MGATSNLVPLGSPYQFAGPLRDLCGVVPARADRTDILKQTTLLFAVWPDVRWVMMFDPDEALARWEPVDGISFDFISADVYSSSAPLELWVRLIDGRTDVSEHCDLIFHFDRVAGYTVHEEFAHPTQGTVWGREPTIAAELKATFPCLIVHGSKWPKSLGDELDMSYPGAIHYRLCSAFPVVDVISANAPIVKWIIRPKTKQIAPGPLWTNLAEDAKQERNQ